MSTLPVLEDVKIPTRYRLSAMWASVMFCYVYGDYFGLYVPGKLQGMLDSHGPIGPTSQGTLFAATIMLAIPAAMIFLSIMLPAPLNRWVNVVLGVAYTVIVLLTMPGGWAFYIFLSTVEIALQLLIVWSAWNWPTVINPDVAGA